MLSVNRCSPTSSFVAVSVSILFILSSFCLWTLMVWAARWNVIYSVPHKREHVECPESKWIRSGPCNLKMCLKITSSFPTFSQSVCKQVAWPRATTCNQPSRADIRVSWSTPNHHHAVIYWIGDWMQYSIWSIHSVADSDSVQSISIEGIFMSISYLFRFR